MSWLSRVRNSISFLPKRQTTDTLWHKCKKCEAMVFTKEWEDNLYCCPRCDHHDRIGPKARFAQIFPFSSPFAMAARAATDDAVGVHRVAAGAAHLVGLPAALRVARAGLVACAREQAARALEASGKTIVIVAPVLANTLFKGATALAIAAPSATSSR